MTFLRGNFFFLQVKLPFTLSTSEVSINQYNWQSSAWQKNSRKKKKIHFLSNWQLTVVHMYLSYMSVTQLSHISWTDTQECSYLYIHIIACVHSTGPHRHTRRETNKQITNKRVQQSCLKPEMRQKVINLCSHISCTVYLAPVIKNCLYILRLYSLLGLICVD